MGTVVSLSASACDAARAELAFADAFAQMERLIAIFSRHTAASALSELNARGVLHQAPVELSVVLDAARRIGRATAYAFNPAIMPVLELLEAKKKTEAYPHPADREFAEALALANPEGIILEKDAIRLGRTGMRLTLDGIAKGFIADEAARAIRARGVENYMVNAGGDIRVAGLAADKRPWDIGIQHPAKRGALLAKVSMTGGGIATSGYYEQAYNGFGSRHPIISHLTGKSGDVASVTVRAGSAMQADALATALALMPPAEALIVARGYSGVSCLILDRQGRLYKSDGWGSAAILP